MSKKMLIDATHPEETRVVVLQDGRLEESDVDTQNKKQIKGNIYLAKIVRVEPSLQAAFVDYGGNRHGFLAFGEIHPDYYQLPIADKEAIKKMMAEEAKAEAESESTENTDAASDVELVSESEAEEASRKRPAFFKKYRIQEVIHQGQVVLIQVVKEERGNKGAALTTYLSLAGRYSVLMPNNGKGGGVSRKISNAKDRKDLRDIVDKLPIPTGMSVIIRTAGQGKTKAEIKRDYDYLIKTWMRIRETTLESIAPKLIHEEGDIIKRSLRDVFTPDIDEVLIEGDDVFKSTRDFVKILMPNQVKKIKQYKGKVPLFQEHHVEPQLESLHNNVVQLRSGGYLVIDQTEALVAVDVNSGRATREHNIEETALRINLETCDEMARQLRLRDLAGLIVIDFIDMDENKHNAAVERRLKEALKKDRARIQVGKISGFGLLEMSRQRLHSSFLESTYKPCPCCNGKGLVRSTESCAMHAIRLLEEAAIKNTKTTLIMSLPTDVATYVLNNKRAHLSSLEDRFKVTIQVITDISLTRVADFKLERLRDDGVRVAVPQSAAPLPPKRDTKMDEAKSKKNDDKKEVATESTDTEPRHRSRNQRRRDWKKKKRMMNEQQTEGTPSTSASPAAAPSTSEENFKVVEQASITETPDAPAKQNRRKKPHDKANATPTTTDAPTSDAPSAPKKGGWWNRLVK